MSIADGPVIIGGGPAGNMAAETLRAEGYAGPITMLSADTALPADRPNLSKDYLAGRAPEEWTLLRSADFYEEKAIDIRLSTRAARIDMTWVSLVNRLATSRSRAVTSASTVA